MECYSEQTCTSFVDGELEIDESRRLRDHLATCQRCRELVETLRAENRILGESLHELAEDAVTCLGLGAFSWQLYRSLRRPAITA